MGLVWTARSTKIDLFSLGVAELFIESTLLFESFILGSLFFAEWFLAPQLHLLFSFPTSKLA